MAYAMSPAQRRAAFLERAIQMFDALEDCYDEHPDASFREIEAEARRQRRELMGQALAILINGRDRGFQLEAPRCQECGQPMEFQGYRGWTIYGLEGDTRLAPAHVQGAVLDTTATLDQSHLIEGESAPLFEDIAHRFRVWVYRANLKRACTLAKIKAVLDREKPAHTEYQLGVIEPRFSVGFQARLGIDAIVGGPPSGLTLDRDQPLGLDTVLTPSEDDVRGTVGHQARVGRDTRLT